MPFCWCLNQLGLTLRATYAIASEAVGGVRVNACSRLLKSGRLNASNRFVAYTNRGGAYADLRQYRRAIHDQDAALRLNPRNAVAYHNRGLSYTKLKQYRRAIEDFNAALRLNPRFAGAYNNRGLTYEALGRRQEAIRDYRQALRLDSSLKESQDGLRRLGLPDANRALQLNPRYAYALDTRAHIYEALGRRQEAIRDHRQVLRLNPSLKESREGLRRLGATP